MAIDDLDVFDAVGRPREANAPLLVEPHAVLTFSIILDWLEPVAQRNLQIIKNGGSVQLRRHSQRRALDVPQRAACVA